jgi:putative Holliday junction resolvase
MSDIKILAIDFGERRIGLAIGDLENKIATPLKTIKNISYESILKEISLIVVEWEINQIVIGIPESYPDQNINKQITNFSKILRKKLKIDVILFNEDFSSNYAQSDLASQMKAGRKKKINKEEIDRIAATIILQSYFENEIFKRANTGITSKD